MTCGLMTNIQNANSVDIPTLLLANDSHPYIGIFMSAVMIDVIFNSCIGMLYPFLSRFTRPGSKGYVTLYKISLVVAFILSFIVFLDLLIFVFKTFGYIGLFISEALLIRWVYNKFSKKRLM